MSAPAKADPKPKPVEELLAFSVARRKDNTFSCVTLKLKGDSITSRQETEPDTLDATLGRLFMAVRRAHTA